MAQGKLHPMVKPALEIGPVLAFFAAYFLLRDETLMIGGRAYDGFVVATAAFVPLLAACTFALWRLTGHLSTMQIMTLILVIVFGGLTVWLNDPRFIKMKPTIIYLLFGAALGVGLLRGTSYLRHVLDGVMPMDEAGWLKLTRRFMLFFFALAIANEIVWRTMSTEAWVWFKTFGLPIALVAFVFAQNSLFHTHELKSDEAPE